MDYELLDVLGQVYATSNYLHAMMLLMKGRWAGKVVDRSTHILYDIEKDGAIETEEDFQAAFDLAWKRCAE